MRTTAPAVTSTPRSALPVAQEAAREGTHETVREAARTGTPHHHRHLIDQAIAWARRLDRGETQAAIIRSYPARRRPSRGYVSIVARLGHALKGLPPLELAAYRSPRVTVRLAQRIIRQHTDTLAVRHHLREAIASPPRDRRRTRGRRPDRRDDRGDHAGRPARPATEAAGDLFVWRWDGAAAERDPAAYVEAYLAFVRALQSAMSHRVRRAVARRTAPPIALAGQSLTALAASIAAYQRARTAAAAGPPVLRDEDRRALELLRRFDERLADVLAAPGGAAASAAGGTAAAMDHE